MENFYFVNWIIGLLVGAMLSLRSMNGGINRHFNKPLGCIAAMMVIWASVFGSVTHAGLIPIPATIKITTSGLSGPCICPPHLTASESSFDERPLVIWRIKMNNLVQPGTDQASNNGNGFELKSIETKSINPPANPLRRDFGDLDALKKSLERDGLQEPLLVYQDKMDKTVIIDGVRRFKCLKELDTPEILCLIKQGTISPREAAHLAFVKNEERKTLGVIEKALHIKRMRTTYKFTLKEMEVKGYGSSANISNYIKLLELPEPVQRQIHKGELSMAHGLHLAKMEEPEEQENMADQIIKEKLSASKAEDRISRFLMKSQMADVQSQYGGVAVKSTSHWRYHKAVIEMAEIPDGSVHCIIAAPPRLIRKEVNYQMPSITEHWDAIRPIMEECARVLASDGVLALVMSDHVDIPENTKKSPVIQMSGHKYQSFLKKGELELTGQIIWDTGSPDSCLIRDSKMQFGEIYHTEYPIRVHHRFINIFRKKGIRIHPSNEDMVKKRIGEEEWSQWTRSVWAIDANQEDPEVLPYELVKRLVLMFTYEGETVLDPFLDTETIPRVAKELQREAFGSDREPTPESVATEKIDMPFEDTLQNIQQTLRSEDWAPDLSVKDTPYEMGDDQEAEEAIVETAEAGLEA